MMDFVKGEREYTFRKKILMARMRVKAMDAIDGFTERNLATITTALLVGLKNPETQMDCAFDALFMLADLAKREDLIS